MIYQKINFFHLINKIIFQTKIIIIYKLVIIHHGQSLFNQENIFTGWTDVDLSKKGIKEANIAGEILKNNSYKFDICFTSTLKRAIKTSFIILDILNQLYIPIIKDFI